MAPFDAIDEAGNADEKAPRVSDRATENTQKLCYRISLTLSYPVRVPIKSARSTTVHRALPWTNPAPVVAAIESGRDTEGVRTNAGIGRRDRGDETMLRTSVNAPKAYAIRAGPSWVQVVLTKRTV
jgi:hypothetical protein